MKKRTSCQFASPLDCDIHSQPEAVVLEGKYWKRDYTVISAEYKKWRRFYHRTIDPNNALESLGDSDLDWISYGDKCLMNAEDNQWTSDLLFSTISQPFAFPDQREIARFGGIADFIQPSLGPLQPNIGEFMDTFDPLELLNANNRLPSVPEEGPDEFLRSINFFGSELNSLEWGIEAPPPLPAISSSSSSSTSSASTTSSGGAIKMPNRTSEAKTREPLYLTTTTTTTPTNEMMMSRGGGGQAMEVNLMGQEVPQAPQVQYTAHMFTQAIAEPQGGYSTGNSGGNLIGGQAMNLLKAIDQQQKQQQQHQQQQQNVQNNAIRPNTTNQLRHFIRREAHNYDKQMPTAHQTLMYNQILSEQQQQQMIQQQTQQQIPQPTDVHMQQQQQQHQLHHQHQQQLRSSSGDQSQSQGNNFLFKPLDDVNMIVGMPVMDDCKDFSRSNSLPVNASMQMMGAGVAPPGMFEMVVEGVPEQQQQQQLQNQNQFLSPRNKIQQQQQQMQQKYHVGLQQQQQQQPSLSVSSQQLTLLNRHAQGLNHHQQQLQGQSYHANSEPALVQLLQHNKGVPKDQLHGQRPYPHVKLEKSLSFHAGGGGGVGTVSDTNNNCDAQATTEKGPLGAFVQHLAHSPGAGGGSFEKKLSSSSPIVSPVASSSSPPDAASSSSVVVFSAKKEMDPVDLLMQQSNDSPGGNKRSGHIYSEQKRRIHIKNGFDLLHSLIPQLQQSSSSAASKMSKAAVLQKGAEYIKQLKVERVATNEKMERLRKERDALNNQISLLHSALPANGAPVSRQRTGKIMDMYNQYVLGRANEHWKFWIFGFLFEPLLLSFNSTVSVASMEDLQRTAMLWVDQNCSLVELRPAITNKLRYLSTTTDILSDEPSTIKDEVMKVINRANSGTSTGIGGGAQQQQQLPPSSSSSS